MHTFTFRNKPHQVILYFLYIFTLIYTHVKNTFILSSFLAEASAKALTPPPKLLADTRFYAIFFYMYKYICFLQEKPLMDDFERKKNVGTKGKIP